jgi:hypothetical protein
MPNHNNNSKFSINFSNSTLIAELKTINKAKNISKNIPTLQIRIIPLKYGGKSKGRKLIGWINANNIVESDITIPMILKFLLYS